MLRPIAIILWILFLTIFSSWDMFVKFWVLSLNKFHFFWDGGSLEATFACPVLVNFEFHSLVLLKKNLKHKVLNSGSCDFWRLIWIWHFVSPEIFFEILVLNFNIREISDDFCKHYVAKMYISLNIHLIQVPRATQGRGFCN